MTPLATALIVTAGADRLTDACVASLTRFAPDCVPQVLDATELDIPAGSAQHFGTLEHVRRTQPPTTDIVILLDSDTVIASPAWLDCLVTPLLADPFVGVVGGLRGRGDVAQSFIDGVPIVHASCLAMRRTTFERVSTFAADEITTGGVQVHDTAARICTEVAAEGGRIVVLPFFRPGTGTFLPGYAVSEYFDPAYKRETLWAHLHHGTAYRPPRLLRRIARAVAAFCGDEHARARKMDAERRLIWLERAAQVIRS